MFAFPCDIRTSLLAVLCVSMHPRRVVPLRIPHPPRPSSSNWFSLHLNALVCVRLRLVPVQLSTSDFIQERHADMLFHAARFGGQNTHMHKTHAAGHRGYISYCIRLGARKVDTHPPLSLQACMHVMHAMHVWMDVLHACMYGCMYAFLLCVRAMSCVHVCM